MANADNSDPPPVDQIKGDKLRDFVVAYSDLARPTSIYLASLALCGGTLLILHEDANKLMALGILAGVITGVSYFRSKDKQTQINADAGIVPK